MTESLQVTSGATYRLTVNCPEGEVAGSTTVPGAFSVERISLDTVWTHASNGDDSARLRVRVDLTPSRGAAAYFLAATCIYVSQGRSRSRDYWQSWSDSIHVWFHTPPSLPDSVDPWVLDTMRLTLFALDSNYQDYRRMQFESGCPDRLIHLDGGVGLFGSICVAETTLWVRELDH